MRISNFEEWRVQARKLLAANQDPGSVLWQDQTIAQQSLFEERATQPQDAVSKFMIPKEFLGFAQQIAHHRDSIKWDKLYQLLWRLTHGERHLMAISSDPLMHDLLIMQKAIRRDAHKMKAFVRFCKFQDEENQDYYLAWYKPDHLIVPIVAPFFQRRFAVMKWIIITPDASVKWDGHELEFSAGQNLSENPKDELEQLWQTYYRAIFNPARIKIKAMKREMPVRYWHNLPETQMIPSLLEEAPERVSAMMKHQEGIKQSAEDFIPEDANDWEKLKESSKHCKGCPLHEHATQTVFGNGNVRARLLMVGEQPGDQEDRRGLPFVGPAGQVLRNALSDLNIHSEDIYLTNAVKHFKFNLKNNYRLHASPGIREIKACKPWVETEIALIKPKVVLCLGLTAAKSLINPAFRIRQERGVFKSLENYVIGATYHPSAILRASTPELRESMLREMTEDIRKAYDLSNEMN